MMVFLAMSNYRRVHHMKNIPLNPANSHSLPMKFLEYPMKSPYYMTIYGHYVLRTFNNHHESPSITMNLWAFQPPGARCEDRSRVDPRPQCQRVAAGRKYSDRTWKNGWFFWHLFTVKNQDLMGIYPLKTAENI